MTNLEVRITRLEPMRVAWAYAFGESPEVEAWRVLLAFAKTKGLLDDQAEHRFFGFNNPDPSPGSPNYGYEQWMAVDADVEPEGEVQIKEFPGGLYAVARCEGVGNIGAVWQQLVTWCEDSHYKKAHHQWLEELLTPPDVPYEEYVFDLYLPISD
jgi:DNA gyrase inhibitor GyrI